MSEYSRGSEWRRWNLYILTPGTKKNDQIAGKNIEEKWDNFYKSINEYIGVGTDPLKRIAVLDMIDYYYIDNYKRIIQERDKLAKSIKLILPNVELRMIPISKNSPINIYCIFSPDIVETLDENFFSKLVFAYNKNDFNCTRNQLIELG